jgi:hypothetical protein
MGWHRGQSPTSGEQEHSVRICVRFLYVFFIRCDGISIEDEYKI